MPALDLDLFDRAHPEHLDVKTLERILSALLALFPQAPVIAMRADGVVVAVPDSIALQGRPVLEGRSGLDLVGFDTIVLAAWDRALAEGAARCPVHPAGRPEITRMLYMLDLRELHGVVLSLTLFDEGDVGDSPDGRPEMPLVAPRFTTIRKDPRSVIVGVDAAITTLLDWSAAELEGHRSIEFMHPDDHALAVDNWMEMLAHPGPARRVRLRHRHRDGSWIWFEVTNHNLLEDPKHGCVVSEMVDITEEMAAHEELRASQQLLHRLAAAVPVGLLQFDATGQVVYTNERLHQILGVERSDKIAQQLSSVTDADQAGLQRALTQVLDSGREANIEVQLSLPPRGTLRFCTVSLRALSREDGTVTGAIACVADVTDSSRMREELKKRAAFDELPGCYNRASIMLSLEASIEGGEHVAERAVLFVDVDRFKAVNDQHGHAAGDEVLRAVAQLLTDVVRERDMVGRIGGDEFLLVCPEIGGPEAAMRLAERLAEAARAQEIPMPSGYVKPRISIGVAWSRGDGASADSIVARADAAMYESKHEGAGRPKLARGR